MKTKRTYCPQCGKHLTEKPEGDVLRDYCQGCGIFFYENPLPVASTIVTRNRDVLLVKRKNEPKKGEWCLPSGFAESGESIEAAALRELEEETGIQGKIIDFVNVDSAFSSYYGDLLFLTFEAEHIKGEVRAGDDASEVSFFPLNSLPQLAFESNSRAIENFILGKQEYWAIVDSFSRSLTGKPDNETDADPASGPVRQVITTDFLSDKLIRIIEKNAEVIANRWLDDVRTNKSTPTYALSDPQTSFGRNKRVLKQFGSWLGGQYSSDDISEFYTDLGRARKKEGFSLSEVISAISLTRKHIWEFALAQHMWTSTIDIYMSLELERRMMLFFDKAAYHITRGYEEA